MKKRGNPVRDIKNEKTKKNYEYLNSRSNDIKPLQCYDLKLGNQDIEI
jgi:hypothetical protein